MSTSDAEDNDSNSDSVIDEVFIPHQNWSSDEEMGIEIKTTNETSLEKDIEQDNKQTSKVSKDDNKEANNRNDNKGEIVHFKYAIMGIEKIETVKSHTQMEVEQLDVSIYSATMETEHEQTELTILEVRIEVKPPTIKKVKKKKISNKPSNKKAKKQEEDELNKLLDQKIKENEKLNEQFNKTVKVLSLIHI